MERGPLHSAGFDLVQGAFPDMEWWSALFRRERRDLVMLHDPGNGELSPREISILDAVAAEHEMDDEWAVGKKTHEFAEFVRNQPQPGKSKTIPFRDVLEAVGHGSEIEAVLNDALHKAEIDSLFGA